MSTGGVYKWRLQLATFNLVIFVCPSKGKPWPNSIQTGIAKQQLHLGSSSAGKLDVAWPETWTELFAVSGPGDKSPFHHLLYRKADLIGHPTPKGETARCALLCHKYSSYQHNELVLPLSNVPGCPVEVLLTQLVVGNWPATTAREENSVWCGCTR